MSKNKNKNSNPPSRNSRGAPAMPRTSSTPSPAMLRGPKAHRRDPEEFLQERNDCHGVTGFHGVWRHDTAPQPPTRCSSVASSGYYADTPSESGYSPSPSPSPGPYGDVVSVPYSVRPFQAPPSGRRNFLVSHSSSLSSSVVTTPVHDYGTFVPGPLYPCAAMALGAHDPEEEKAYYRSVKTPEPYSRDQYPTPPPEPLSPIPKYPGFYSYPEDYPNGAPTPEYVPSWNTNDETGYHSTNSVSTTRSYGKRYQ